MNTQKNVLISQLTTMRLGGLARYLIEIKSESDLIPAYDFVDENNLPTYILGGGSNVIGRDQTFEGAIILNRLLGIEEVRKTGDELILRVATGVDLDALVDYAVDRSWYGIEALAMIPGTVGGAIMQNAGAYGQEMAQVLEGVDAFNIEARQHVHISADKLEMGYRHSIFNCRAGRGVKGKYFITAAHLRLHKQEIQGQLYGSLQDYLTTNGVEDRRAETIRDAVNDIRASKLPDSATTASSGSFFKNITVNPRDMDALHQRFPGIPIFEVGSRWEVPSGWLIEQVGLKGQLLHGMRVSDKAALILINESAESYESLAKARAEIAAAVKEKFGFELEQEPEEI
jgi:UDP-N-acetylmuramate dehydrogenase